MDIGQMDAEVVEAVAGVVPLLRREAELATHLRLEAVLIIFVGRWRESSVCLSAVTASVALIIMTNSETKMILMPRWYTVALQGEGAVQPLFRTTADYLASAIADLVNTLDLDLVSLAGPGFAELGGDYRRVISDRLAEVAFMREVHPITVRLGVGGPDAAALGAASVVLHRELIPHRSAVPL